MRQTESEREKLYTDIKKERAKLVEEAEEEKEKLKKEKLKFKVERDRFSSQQKKTDTAASQLLSKNETYERELEQ